MNQYHLAWLLLEQQSDDDLKIKMRECLRKAMDNITLSQIDDSFINDGPVKIFTELNKISVGYNKARQVN
jgi:hypothetical protein